MTYSKEGPEEAVLTEHDAVGGICCASLYPDCTDGDILFDLLLTNLLIVSRFG